MRRGRGRNVSREERNEGRDKDKGSRAEEKEDCGEGKMETRDGGWRVVYSVSVEGWTKRGFKLPRFISINTTVLCPTTEQYCLLCFEGGWPLPSLLPLVGRGTTTGKQMLGNTGGAARSLARGILPISYLLSFFTGRKGRGRRSALAVGRFDR